MKKLNTILAGIFAAISMTEITRAEHEEGQVSHHHGHHQHSQRGSSGYPGAAYAAGHHHGQEQEENENNENGSGESTGSTTESTTSSTNSSTPAPVVVQFLDEESDENYADDAVVQIQALGDGSLLANLSPEQKDMFKARIAKRLADPNNSSDQGVVTQSMSDFDDNEEAFMQGDDADDAIIQSIEAEHHEEHVAQPATAPLEQAVHATSDLVQTVEHQEHPVSAPEPALMHATQPAAPEHQAESQVQPFAQKQSEEQIKIVKVYPVYDAIKSGAEMVKAAANDMYNYVYNLISSYRSGRAEKAEVQVQLHPSKW